MKYDPLAIAIDGASARTYLVYSQSVILAMSEPVKFSKFGSNLNVAESEFDL